MCTGESPRNFPLHPHEHAIHSKTRSNKCGFFLKSFSEPLCGQWNSFSFLQRGHAEKWQHDGDTWTLWKKGISWSTFWSKWSKALRERSWGHFSAQSPVHTCACLVGSQEVLERRDFPNSWKSWFPWKFSPPPTNTCDLGLCGERVLQTRKPKAFRVATQQPIEWLSGVDPGSTQSRKE